jgi:hypothetical protein
MRGLGLGLGFARQRAAAPRGAPRPPAGFILLTDADGAFLTDADGAYLMEAL